LIKRTIEISSGPTYLSVKNDQLVITRNREVLGTIPCEDIGVVVVDDQAVTYTHSVLTALAGRGAFMVACGADHHPGAMVCPLTANTLHTERLRLQIESSRPCGKRIWQQIVKAKIMAQAELLGKDDRAFAKLATLAGEVRSGDPSNVEAHAAKVYWRGLFPDGSFRRHRDGEPPNNLLNYGYMALRAAVARAVCAAGLHPSIGLHHRNRYNPFCLADDLVEPLRPLVDARVRELWQGGKTDVDRETKAVLLGVLTETVRTGGESGPLLVALGKMVASLVAVMSGKVKKLQVPRACK